VDIDLEPVEARGRGGAVSNAPRDVQRWTQANAGMDRVRTLRCMFRRSSPLDRRLLLPREYLVDPYRFGTDLTPQWVLPPGGDQRSLRVAMVQHDIARLLRSHCPRIGQRVGDRFAFSRQQWSKCTRGQAWMGPTVLSGAIWALRTIGPWR
jgi:hypothetical protein